MVILVMSLMLLKGMNDCMEYSDALALVHREYGTKYDLSNIGYESNDYFLIPPADIEAEGAPSFRVNKLTKTVVRNLPRDSKLLDELFPEGSTKVVTA